MISSKRVELATLNGLLKIFLLHQIRAVLVEYFADYLQPDLCSNSLTECYMTDSKITELLIHSIVESGEYTLEGIAYYTRIPYDVILDAACGNTSSLTITPWARLVDLYLQVKPEVAQLLFEKLATLANSNEGSTADLLNDRAPS